MRAWLKTARANANITQEQIALLAGITRVFYTNLENGKRRPSPETAKKIAAILNFNWTRFFE